MTKKKIMTEEPVQRFGIRKLSVGVLSVLVSSTLVSNAAKAHAETATNVEKTATDESDTTSSSKIVTAESGIVVDKASDKAEGDTSTSEEAKDDQSSATSAKDEPSATTEREKEVEGDATTTSKESSTESTNQAIASEAKSDTSSTQESQTSSQSSSTDDSAASLLSSSLVSTSMSTREKMRAAVNALKVEMPPRIIIDDGSSTDTSESDQDSNSSNTGTNNDTPRKVTSWASYDGGILEVYKSDISYGAVINVNTYGKKYNLPGPFSLRGMKDDNFGTLYYQGDNLMLKITTTEDYSDYDDPKNYVQIMVPGWVPLPQKATVLYVDDNTGKTLDSDTLTGSSGANSSYTTADKIKTYEGQGYVLVSDDTNGQEITFDNDYSVDQTYTVHLKHGTKQSEDGNHTQHVTVNRTIIYKMSDGSTAPAAVEDSLNFTGQDTIDTVTGEVLSTTWSGAQDFKDVTSPTVIGYTPDRTIVSNKGITHDSADITEVVTYTPDAQKATVTYIDDNTGKELTSDALNGKSNAKSGYSTADKIKIYEGQGYVLVSDDTNGQEIVYDNDSSTDQKYTVHLKHGTVLNSLTDTVNRTINYKMSDGSKAPDSVHDTLTYTANTLVDKVTGEILSTDWSPAQDFKDVTSPEVAHYVPDRTVVSNKGIAHDHADIVEEVIYTPKNEVQKAKVTYIDETTGKTLKADELKGTSNAKSGYTTAKSIEDYQNLGYVLVSDETSGQEVVFDDDTSKDQEYKVVLKHGYETAKLTEDVHRVITYRMSDSSKAPDQVENVLHFTAKKVVDKVTGEVVSTEWSAPQDFEDVASPAVKGYVADKAVVSNKDIAHDHSDIHEIVTYTPAEQKATVTYVDSLTGKTIMTKELVGKSNAASGYKTEADIKSLVDKGYVFESDETNGQEVVFDDDATVDQNYVVKLTHKFEESEETHQATRKIRLHEPDDLKVITQIGSVKRSVKIDSVTGEKTYGDWTQDKWAEFDTPVLDGYTASLDKVEEKAVGGDTKDEVVDIYYNKPEEPAPAPQEPEKPAEPTPEPEEPAKPAEPTPEEPEKPAKPAPEKKEAPAPAKPKAKVKTTVVTTTQAKLPQTGNKDDKAVKASGVLAIGASLMATLFSSFKKKTK